MPDRQSNASKRAMPFRDGQRSCLRFDAFYKQPCHLRTVRRSEDLIGPLRMPNGCYCVANLICAHADIRIHPSSARIGLGRHLAIARVERFMIHKGESP